MSYTINDYLSVPYVNEGRDMSGFDCWGQTRHRIHHYYGQPLFESFGHIHPDDKNLLTEAYQQIVSSFRPCEPSPGAVVCGFKFGSLIHIGTVELIDGKLEILHTSRRKGPSIDSIDDFKRLFKEVKFYEYVG